MKGEVDDIPDQRRGEGGREEAKGGKEGREKEEKERERCEVLEAGGNDERGRGCRGHGDGGRERGS